MTLDDGVLAALRGAADGRTPIDLAETTQADYSAVTATLERLEAAGVVQRSRSRVGAWRLATDRVAGSESP